MNSRREQCFSSTAWCKNPRVLEKGRSVPRVVLSPDTLLYLVLIEILVSLFPFLEGVDIAGGLPTLVGYCC